MSKRAWRRRWFELKDCNLSYFKKRNDTKMRGRMVIQRGTKLHLGDDIVSTLHNKDFVFRIETNHGVLTLHAENDLDFRMWVSYIRKVGQVPDETPATPLYKPPVRKRSQSVPRWDSGSSGHDTADSYVSDHARRNRHRERSMSTYSVDSPSRASNRHRLQRSSAYGSDSFSRLLNVADSAKPKPRTNSVAASVGTTITGLKGWLAKHHPFFDAEQNMIIQADDVTDAIAFFSNPGMFPIQTETLSLAERERLIKKYSREKQLRAFEEAVKKDEPAPVARQISNNRLEWSPELDELLMNNDDWQITENGLERRKKQPPAPAPNSIIRTTTLKITTSEDDDELPPPLPKRSTSRHLKDRVTITYFFSPGM